MEGTDLRGRRPDRRHVGSAAVGRTGDLPATPSKRLDGTGFPQQCSFCRICEDFHEERQGPGRPATRESGETPVHGSSDCRNPRTMFGVDSHIREKLQFALGKPRFRPSDGQPQAATVNQTPPSEWQRKGWQAARQPSTPNWLLALWTRNLSGLHGRLTDACRRPKRRNLGHGPLKGLGREHPRHAPEGKWLPSRCYVDADVVMAGRASRAGRCRGRPCFARQGGITVGHAWRAGRGQGPLKGKERPKAAPLIGRQIVVASALRRHVHAGFGVLRTAGLAGCPRAFLWREALFPAGYSAFSEA